MKYLIVKIQNKYGNLFYLINPENPKNAIAIKPAVINTMGVPLKDSGTSLYSIFSRMPAIITIATIKPNAVPNPFTTEEIKP